MPNKRVTMQDIANACGLSRNTVSKVFNSRGAVPPATQALIMKKAEELGYGQPMGESPMQFRGMQKTIALLTCNLPADYQSSTYFTTVFTNQISRSGYMLKMFEISPEELKAKLIPPHFVPEETAGIVGIELFDPDYLDMICTLGLPTIIIDGPARATTLLMTCDCLMMENIASIAVLIQGLRYMGARRIGFVGDRDHCSSFYERWTGFRIGLETEGLPMDKKCCILAPDSSPYHDTAWLLTQLNQMPALPDAFVCANDYLAVHLMTALKSKGLSIPSDIMITGFNDVSQSALLEPALTTVHIPGVEIGHIAAEILLARIQNKIQPYAWIHVKTTPIWRDSTRKLPLPASKK